ncbi:MAG: tRNA lysidine(34) synthetase TilS [Betaproteobacteria bacterium]|nr:tRNA lysidine(34) synthetase TilS [Betaproteobacteria bacterium]
MPSPDIAAALRASARRHVAAGSCIVVALSGGVDSIVLLHGLVALRSELALDLRGVHINHGLSPNADAWERFCVETCATLGVSCTVVRLGLVRRAGESLEAQARTARYAALERAALELGAGVIALAQHVDDQAETVLLQLLRGAAAKGLAGMAEWRRPRHGCCHWRPLLHSNRMDIVDSARARGLRWIEDESNADPSHKRNFLRTQVLPRLQDGFPGYRTSLSRSAANAAEAAQLLDQLADLDAEAIAGGERLPVAALRKLGGLRTGNLLRRILAQRGIAVPAGERLREFIRQAFEAREDRHPMLELDGECALAAERGQLGIIRVQPPSPILATWHGESVIELAHGRLRFAATRGTGIRAALVPAGGLAIGCRHGGERLRVAPNRPLRTLKNLMQEAGIPAAARGRWPLVSHECRLVAVPGIGVG